MKKMVAYVLVLCAIIALAGCGKSQDESSESKPLDLSLVLSDSVTEIVIKASGEERHITESNRIKEVVDTVKQIEFKQSKDGDINAPGAISVTVDLYTESGTTTITLPCYLYEGNVYSAGVDSIKLFGKYFEQ